MNAFNESLSVTGADTSRSPHKSRRRERYAGTEITRQLGGWFHALVSAGFGEARSRKLSRAYVFGPIVTLVIIGLMRG